MALQQAKQGLTIAEIIAFIIAAAEWLKQNEEAIAEVGGWWAALTGGVTNIKKWVNETDQEIEVYKYDGGDNVNKKDRQTIAPGESITHTPQRKVEMWIPWANSAAEFSKGARALILVGGQPLAYVWQSGRFVRFNAVNQFVPDGTPVPGASNSGGDRAVVVGRDPLGQLTFAFGSFIKT